MSFVHLDVTTNFSFLRGASHPDELVRQAAARGYSAIGIADLNTLAGMVRAHQAAKECAIRLCVGCRLRLADAPDCLVWPHDRGGYGGLCRLLTAGKRRAEKGQCLLYLADLLDFAGGLEAALVPQSIDPEAAAPDAARLDSAAGTLKEAFAGRLSIAAFCPLGPNDPSALARIAALCQSHGIAMLATNQVHYHDARRRMLQDILTCIRHGCTIHDAGFRLFPNAQRALHSLDRMKWLFESFPAALDRSLEIADRCRFSLDELRYEYPDEIVPPGQTSISYLAELAWSGAAGRYPGGVPAAVRGQIEHELRLIEQLHIEPYFLTVYDLVKFARSRGILCQGRGSAANSAVCYCIGVTSVDPDRIDVLFERFVSAARGEPPDIDIDFEHERREEVIQYLYKKYGRDRAGIAAEIISYRGRSAVRDVGKALGLGLDAVDQMAKRLDGWDAGAPSPEQVRQAGVDPEDRAVRLVLTLTAQLLGFPRHLGQHVGGMVMTRGPLCELVPIENASMPGRTVIEWDKNDIDALGILKVDVLALGMLTCISKSIAMINNLQSAAPLSLAPLSLATIPAEDAAVYEMISNADTIGVFQIESRAQMSMLPRLRPRKFYDLVIEVAIVRPGPIQGDMVHPYLRRREGLEPVCFPKPELKAVLGKTLGVPLFQEQAMKLTMVAAGFSADEADQLRRAMAAWRYSGSIERFHQKIIDGMLANGYTLDFAERCFNQIKGFGEYGFPESHAASFALLVYASAWIKCHHPAVFCAALLNSQPMGFYAPAQIVSDARHHGVEVRSVDVNDSEYDCMLESSPETGPAVRLGFRLIRGFSEVHAEKIVESRRRWGAFTGVDQFQSVTRLSAAVIARLCAADAFASLPKTRRTALWESLALPEQRPALPLSAIAAEPPALPVQSRAQEIHADYVSAGLSLKGHPLEAIRPDLNRLRITPSSGVWKLAPRSWVRVAGLVLIRQRPGSASGIVFETLEDETGIVNLIIRPEVYERFQPAARHASILQADGRVERRGKVQHIMAVRLYDRSELLADHLQRSRDFH